MKRTKIVCTIGPASSSPGVLRELIRSGMNVARVNFSHGDHDTHLQSISTVRTVAEEENRLVAIMGDLQGPKLRVGEIGRDGLRLRAGDRVRLVAGSEMKVLGEIPVPHPELLCDLQVGDHVLLDDGSLDLVVLEKDINGLDCAVVYGGVLSSRKGINVPGANLTFPALTAKDQADAQFAVEQGVDLLALSFVRQPDDVRRLRAILDAMGADVPIIAKIEKREALLSFERILAEADGIMVARGDLGVETPAEEVPFHQKRIIHACNEIGKPVITATQMLQSMIDEPRPTRAEASDVANAILDGTDAVMLSGETAIGRYPVEAIRIMTAICCKAEAHLGTDRLFRSDALSDDSVTEAISYAAVKIAGDVGARGIVTGTMSGTTARMVARYRPSIPIVAMTPSRNTVYRLLLTWGVEPVLVGEFSTTDEMMRITAHTIEMLGLGDKGDRVVLTAGIPFGFRRRTNMLRVLTVGENGAG